MPAEYCSITLVGPSQLDAVRALLAMHRSAYVLATEQGMTVVCDEESDGLDPLVVSETASRLALSLQCFAFAAASNREDSLEIGVFGPDGARTVWNSRRVLTCEADSSTMCHAAAQAIGEAFRVRDKAAAIEEILRVPPALRNGCCPAEDVLSAIGDIVPIPTWAYVGFTDIDEERIFPPEGAVRVGQSNEMADLVPLPAGEDQINGRSVAEWCEQLLKGSASKRFRAVWELATHPPEARQAAPALVAALGDHDGRFLLRALAAYAIGQIGEPAEIAVPSLMKLLDDHSPNARAAATEALGKLGPSARAAASKIGELLGDTAQFSIADETTIPVRVAAAIALARITPAAANYRAALHDSITELERHCSAIPRAKELLDSIPRNLPPGSAEAD